MKMTTTTTNEITTSDIIDVRDVIARVEELEDASNEDNFEEEGELVDLRALLDDLCGNGGDEQWKGDWYPLMLIRDDHFEDYARELAEDIGAIPDNAQWPCTCIDWEQAARELRMDYTSTEFDGVTYWYR